MEKVIQDLLAHFVELKRLSAIEYNEVVIDCAEDTETLSDYYDEYTQYDGEIEVLLVVLGWLPPTLIQDQYAEERLRIDNMLDDLKARFDNKMAVDSV